MNGRRVRLGTAGDMDPGDYFQEIGGTWWVYPPAPYFGGAVRLTGWNVTEHDDGTITVSPSIHILETNHNPDWHGFLEHGEWRQA